jgi:hypothetical protein
MAIEKYLEEESPPHMFQVEDAIELAGRLQSSLPRPDGGGDGQPAQMFSIGNRQIVTSDQICDAHEWRITSLRERLFDSSSVPFRTALAAKQWLERTSRRELGGRNLLRVAQRQAARMNRHNDPRKSGVAIGYTYLIPRVVIPSFRDREGKWRGGSVEGPFMGTISRISHLAKEIAGYTRFTEEAVTAWFLLDQRPVLPRLKMTTHWHALPGADEWLRSAPGARRGDDPPGHYWVTMEIHAADLHRKELMDAYNRIRDLPNARRQKINGLHYRIYQLVREAGGLPRGGRVEFWKRIRGNLLDEGRRNVPEWQAVRKAGLKILGTTPPADPAPSLPSPAAPP